MRVLRVLTRPNVGGPMRQAVALWHEHRRLGLQSLLVVGKCASGEAAFDLGRTGIPRCSWSDLADQPERAEGILEIGRLGRALLPGSDVRAALQLRRVAQAFRPDVVHTHTSKAGLLGRDAAWRSGVPVVAHTFHGHVLRDYYSGAVSFALRQIEARLARRTDLVFAVSPSCGRDLTQLGIANGQLRVVPPAVDVRPFEATSREAARDALGVSGDRAAIGFVGRLVPIKRPRLFLDVLRQLGSRGTGFVFGAGPERVELERARDVDVRFMGATEELPRLLAGIDVLVVPSLREGCPLAAVEAFAAGVPVVGFDVPGVQDILGAWGAGVLVPPEQGARGLATAVEQLLGDDARRRDLVERARSGLRRFAPAVVARQLADAYAEGLADQASRASSGGVTR